MSTTDIIRAYRQLYRTGLRAVRYARPARFELRDVLRESFRTQPSAAFNARRIGNTLNFLETAGTHNGTEHKILKNLLHLQFWRWYGTNKALLRNQNSDYAVETRLNTWRQYQATLTMLNESLDMCLQIGAEKFD
ncbi:hypothetical protein EDD37DRAFT_81902 [Exophiala viscosa]|uniref:DUF1763-domain-containing protein n=1 Tax=Exophiala viscosa TaxID=2486360 RepID=A0AAN6IFQ8_9EURO|nr:hypothetical protein EDD36DRAFT_133799 [Exophiala viscosa]KAI1630073.1 hypothetical protein EDD37DRAFT_81902 [Exophiala viscosa]